MKVKQKRIHAADIEKVGEPKYREVGRFLVSLGYNFTRKSHDESMYSPWNLIWGRFPFWLIFFKWGGSTTNQWYCFIPISEFIFSKGWNCWETSAGFVEDSFPDKKGPRQRQPLGSMYAIYCIYLYLYIHLHVGKLFMVKCRNIYTYHTWRLWKMESTKSLPNTRGGGGTCCLWWGDLVRGEEVNTWGPGDNCYLDDQLHHYRWSDMIYIYIYIYIHMFISLSCINIFIHDKRNISIDMFYCMITFSLCFNASSMVRIGW